MYVWPHHEHDVIPINNKWIDRWMHVSFKKRNKYPVAINRTSISLQLDHLTRTKIKKTSYRPGSYDALCYKRWILNLALQVTGGIIKSIVSDCRYRLASKILVSIPCALISCKFSCSGMDMYDRRGMFDHKLFESKIKNP